MTVYFCISIIIIMQNIETKKYVVLALELMKGGDLFGYLCDRGRTAADVALPEDLARKTFRQIVAGVSYAHNQNIIHCDLKLENIL